MCVFANSQNLFTRVFKQQADLLIGLSRALVLVLTFTKKTSLYASGMILSTLPNIQDPWGAVESTIITISPVWMFCFVLAHFCHSCINGKYSWVHLFQNKSGIYWTCFHLHLRSMSDFWKSPSGKTGLDLNSRTWLGVSGHGGDRPTVEYSLYLIQDGI